jgi:hypothetical protein
LTALNRVQCLKLAMAARALARPQAAARVADKIEQIALPAQSAYTL